MSILDKILEFIRSFGKPEEREASSSPQTASEIKNAKLKEIGRLKGESAVLKKRLKQEREEKKHLKKMLEGEETLAEKVEERREELKGFREEDVLFLDNVPKNIAVMSKFHKTLGYLYGFYIDKDTGHIGIALTEEPGGGEIYSSRAWLSSSISSIVHHPENLKDMLESGNLILNVTWEGEYIEDMDTMIPAKDAIPTEG